jgi:hypothetical protein
LDISLSLREEALTGVIAATDTAVKGGGEEVGDLVQRLYAFIFTNRRIVLFTIHPNCPLRLNLSQECSSIQMVPLNF